MGGKRLANTTFAVLPFVMIIASLGGLVSGPFLHIFNLQIPNPSISTTNSKTPTILDAPISTTSIDPSADLLTGTIIVNKNTIGGDGTFGFTGTNGLPSSFSITTTNGFGSITLNGIAEGTYGIA